MTDATPGDRVLVATAPSRYVFEELSGVDTFLAGLVSGVLARTLVCPFDVVKLLVQVDSRDRGFLHSVRVLYDRAGIKAFWTGNWVGLSNQGLYSATKFLMIKELRPLFGSRAQRFRAAASGALAGAIAQAALYPMDLVRTRIILYPGRYSSFFQAAGRIIAEDGVTALWTGLAPTIVGSIPYEGTNYLVYDGIRSLWLRRGEDRRMTPLANAVIGAAAGLVSQAVAYPFEVVRRLMMMTGDDGRRLYGSMGEGFKDVWGREGLKGLFRGLKWNTVKAIPFAALQYTLYDEACRAFRDVRRRGLKP